MPGGGGRGENVMALWGSITFFEKRYSVMGPHKKRYSVMRNFDVMALWRSITLFSITLCVTSTFQKRFSVMAPTNRTLCVIGVFSSDVIALWCTSPKKALWRYGCFQKSVMAL